MKINKGILTKYNGEVKEREGKEGFGCLARLGLWTGRCGRGGDMRDDDVRQGVAAVRAVSKGPASGRERGERKQVS